MSTGQPWSDRGIDGEQRLAHISSMEISVIEARAQLPDLVRRAEEGEDVTLTRGGHPVVRLVPVPAKPVVPDQATRKALLETLSKAGKEKATPGPCAARSQDFLYNEFGLPK